MVTTMPTGLLEAIKAYLHITWDDINTEKNITDAINSSVAYLQRIAGVSTIDFTVEGLARDLLKDRCRYINSQALEMFEKNFASELMTLHIQNLVDAEEDVIILKLKQAILNLQLLVMEYVTFSQQMKMKKGFQTNIIT